MLSAAPVFQRLGANSSDSLESQHPRRIDASIARAANRITVRGRAASTTIAHRSYRAPSIKLSGSLVRVLIAAAVTSTVLYVVHEKLWHALRSYQITTTASKPVSKIEHPFQQMH
jgi:uncharacterized membrane protein